MTLSDASIIGDISESNNEGKVDAARGKACKDKRNYASKPYEEFVAVDAGIGEQAAPEINFEREGVGWESIRQFRDKKPGEIAEHLMNELMVHTVKMFNFNREADVKELTYSKLMAWVGIHMFLHTWRYPDRSRYWGSGSYAGLNVPDVNLVMSYKDWLGIRRNLRFQDYSREDELKGEDRAWKVRPLVDIVKRTLKKINPAPGQYLSLDEAMILYTGFRCPTVVGAPSKPIKRGIKLYVLVDYSTGIVVDFNVHDGSVKPEQGESFPGGVVGLHVHSLLQTLKGKGYVVFMDNFYSSVAIARKLLERDIRVVGTLRKPAMTDVEKHILLGNAKSMKPTKSVGKGVYKVAKTKDGKIFAVGLMDTRAVYFLDSAFGFVLSEISRRVKGAKDMMKFLAPLCVLIYNKYMGGVDELDRLRMGFHGFEGIGRAHKWTARFFDAMVNILMQTAYRIYKWCRDNKLGNEKPMTHAEFNESVIDYFMNNEAWKSEKRSLAGDRRSSSRSSELKSKLSASSLTQGSSTIHHSLQYCSEKYEVENRSRKFSKACVVCKGREAQKPDLPLRVSWYCKECSAGCVRIKDRVFLHPQCFGEYHNTFNTPSRVIQSELSYC